MLGIDALWGVFSDLNSYLTQTKLIISFGDQTTHIIPILDGQVCYTNIKRINVGGQHRYSFINDLVHHCYTRIYRIVINI